MFIRALVLFAALAVACAVRAQTAPGESPAFVAPPPTAAGFLAVPPFPEARVGQPFTFSFSGFPSSTRLSVDGLPPGLYITAKGEIAGTPLEASVFSVTFSGAYKGGAFQPVNQDLMVQPAFDVVNIAAKVPRIAVHGGKAAVFTVTREGDASRELIVSYSSSGSFREGQDYPLLYGQVFFRVNQYTAKVRVVPYNQTTVDKAKTVRLTLDASPSEYVLGNASALIKIVPAGP